MKDVRGLLIAAATVVAASLGVASSGQAAFSDCPRRNPTVNSCIEIRSTGGSLDIKGFTVPLGDSLEIQGGIYLSETGPLFVPPTNGNGFRAEPVNVPGGLLGIDFPIPGNAVTATAVLAGPSSGIHLDLNTLSISMPIKLLLENPILGPFCRIGTDASPVRLNLITGTTSPPAPNRPLSGHLGVVSFPGYALFTGNRNVDNSFAIPSASNCGLGLGLVNALINAKLKLPSAGGNNTMIVDNDVAIGSPL